MSIRKAVNTTNRGSLQAQLCGRFFKAANQYIALQWFYGYDESLIGYNQFTNKIRIGLMIKPYNFDFY